MTELLVGIACYLTVFSTKPGIGTNMQLAALAVLAAAAGYSLLVKRVKAFPMSAAEIVLYAVGIDYVILGVFGPADAGLLAIAFLVAILSISIVARSISLEGLLDICGRVALLGVATVIVFDHQQGMLALSSGLGRGSGITRFAPLGFHPDLTGYVFGASVWLMARRVLVTTHWLERVLMVGGALAASLFVLAASSRSSLIALFVAGLVAITIEYRLGRLFSKRWVRIGCVLFAIFGAIFYEKIAAYFIKMLDLDSSWRGVNSGGSGRTDLWARGIATFFQDPLVFIFGGGFRSSNAEQIGFSTESSYISILLDSGAFLGVAIILVFWYAPIKALRLTNPADRYASPLVLLAAFMTFIIVESVFNRYLLAIGNPASLMSLLILLSLSMRQNLASSAVPKANNWTAAQPTLK